LVDNNTNSSELMKSLITLTPEEKNYRATVIKEAMMAYQVRKNRSHTKWLSYVNSTALKYNFANWILHAYYIARNLTASIITIEMGCSRKAIDEMVSDWHESNWIIKIRGTDANKNKFYLTPTNEVLEHQHEWFSWYEDTIQPMRNEAWAVLYDSRKKPNKAKADFNTLETTNMRGIESSVSSFIIDPKKRVNGG
jgi:hypothetical protein